MILSFLAAAALAAGADPAEAARYRQCLATAGAEPALAVTEATRWLGGGGGVPARHCLALAYLAQRQYAPAALALEAAARAAEAAHEPHAAALWGQAGDAWLAGDDAGRGLADLTSALGAGAAGAERAQLLVDRARALVALRRDGAARADLDAAVGLDSANADAWLLRATLARRTDDLAAAEASILEAARLAPGDGDVALEAGNIAAAQGRLDLARQAWRAAAAAGPDAPAGVAAAQALAANPATAKP